MPYNVPNGPDVPVVDLAEPDSGDFLALGYQRTGVVSGGTVTQSGSPNMTVLVAAAEIVIEGVPITKTAGSVVLDASTASPRFDLIGWNVAGAPVAIKGTPSNNPSFPVFDPSVFCMTAAIYVTAGTSTITSPYIVQKQVVPPLALRRHYANDTDIVIESTTPMRGANAFRLLASGAMQWLSSTLASINETVMEMVATLQIRQTANTDKALILKVTGAGVKGNNIFEVQGASALAPLVGIDTIGRFFSTNFRVGNGSPEGAVTADAGTLFLNEAPTDANTALYIKLTNGVATGWAALGAFVPSSQAVPVGTVIAWPGVLVSMPVGYLYCDGTEYASATYTALSDWCAGRFGAAAVGNFKLPDYRGRTLFGVEGTLATAPGTNVGADTVTLTLDQIPSHTHPTTETPHGHAQDGAYLYKVDQVYSPPWNIDHNDSTGLGVGVEANDSDHTTETGLTVQAVGGGQSFSTYQPSQSTYWIIKT